MKLGASPRTNELAAVFKKIMTDKAWPLAEYRASPWAAPKWHSVAFHPWHLDDLLLSSSGGQSYPTCCRWHLKMVPQIAEAQIAGWQCSCRNTQCWNLPGPDSADTYEETVNLEIPEGHASWRSKKRHDQSNAGQPLSHPEQTAQCNSWFERELTIRSIRRHR